MDMLERSLARLERMVEKIWWAILLASFLGAGSGQMVGKVIDRLPDGGQQKTTGIVPVVG
jgi:hypothetical protein